MDIEINAHKFFPEGLEKLNKKLNIKDLETR